MCVKKRGKEKRGRKEEKEGGERRRDCKLLRDRFYVA